MDKTDRLEKPEDHSFFGNIDVEMLIHELKDPISVIETAVRMMLEKADKYGPLTHRQERTLRRALRSSKKARGLLADLLEVGRSDAGQFHCCRFDPASAVDEVLMEVLEAFDADLWETLQDAGQGSARKALMNHRGIRLTCSDAVGGAMVCQDETKFRQIVGNLLKNAFQHRRRQVEISVDCGDDRLTVSVGDDGPGIEKEHLELIFKRYTRIEAEACNAFSRPGHGLGLAGARILARHLGGDITVKSSRGAGAHFCLVLPLSLAHVID